MKTQSFNPHLKDPFSGNAQKQPKQAGASPTHRRRTAPKKPLRRGTPACRGRSSPPCWAPRPSPSCSPPRRSWRSAGGGRRGARRERSWKERGRRRRSLRRRRGREVAGRGYWPSPWLQLIATTFLSAPNNHGFEYLLVPNILLAPSNKSNTF